MLEHLDAVGGDGASTAGADGPGQPRQEPRRGDAEGARRRGRRAARGLALARARRQPWRYDAERYERITALRRREQAAMAQLGADGRCLMRALQEELDDPAPDGLRSLLGLRRPALRRAARRGARARRPRCTCARARWSSRPRRWRRTRRARCRRSPRRVRVEEGRALARLGDGGWDPLVRQGRRDGRFADELVDGGRGGRAQLGRAGRVGDRGARRGAAASSCRTSRAGWRSASGCPTRPCSSAPATRRRSARWPTPSSRSPTCAGSSRSPASAPEGAVPARRRHPLQRLDARDGRRPAARPRRRRRSTRSRSRPRSRRADEPRRCRAGRWSAISATRRHEQRRARARPAGDLLGSSGANMRQPCLAPAIRRACAAG